MNISDESTVVVEDDVELVFDAPVVLAAVVLSVEPPVTSVELLWLLAQPVKSTAVMSVADKTFFILIMMKSPFLFYIILAIAKRNFDDKQLCKFNRFASRYFTAVGV